MTQRSGTAQPFDGSIRYAMETLVFFQTIREAWCRETSADPDIWTPEVPAIGQCAVTAMVVQDGLGGDLLRSTVKGISHYWNSIPGMGELDLTRAQFGIDAIPDAPPIIRDREYLDGSPDTWSRYELLRERMGL